MGKIKLLDELTIQKIAAGEVIERPSSIVKELVENSLDAGSTNIVVEISNGGKSYIRVTDNGDGIGEEDVELAFKRHSTSKLNAIEDLDSILTLGFRGEALSSISAVSKIELITKTDNSNAGLKLKIVEGNIISKDKIGTPKGTTMIIRDLFFNLPVRRKFLKSDTSESNSIGDIINKLALGNPNSSFKYIKDDKVILNTSANTDIKQTIYTVLGKDITKNLIPIKYTANAGSISGYISNNSLYRSNKSHQYIFVNGRYIVNNAISNAIEYHYKSIIPINRFPVFILYINIDPSKIDVNIHPTKQEIKLLEKDEFIGLLSNIIKDNLNKSLFVPTFEMEKDATKKEVINPIYDKSIESNLIVKDYSNYTFRNDNMIAFEDNFSENEINDNQNEFGHNIYEHIIDSSIDTDRFRESEIQNKKELSTFLPEVLPLSIVFNTYILGENKNKDKLFFIDQHAAHERIMFEKFLKEYKEENIYTQILISPYIIDLTDSELNKYIKNADIFKKMGFDIDEFGSRSIAIRAVPVVFGQPDVSKLFIELLDNIDKEMDSAYDLKLEKLMKLACTYAVKSGDKMDKLEVEVLLKNLAKCESPYTCPHGRPTILEISKKDIEKQFLRI